MFKRMLSFTLDERADTIAPWTFLAGSVAFAAFLMSFHGIMVFIYLAGFVAAGILSMLLFSLAVSKYRDRKYQEETKAISEYGEALNAVKRGAADDLSDEQISLLVKRSRSE